jgi:hypothetical protein
MSAAAASLSIDDTNSTTAAEDNGSTAATISDDVSLNTTTTTSTIQLAVEPFAIGQYAILSENMISQTETQLSFEGNTTIISPHTTETETMMARDTGEVIFSLLPAHGSGIIRGQFHMTTEDGSESATADFTEFVRFESPTAIGIAYFSTNSTGGMLASLNNMIAVLLHEEQPNGSVIVSFFEYTVKSSGAR